MPVVYILELVNGQYYVGSTDNIERRIFEHNSGKTAATRYKRPVKLIFIQSFFSLSEARRVEYKIKKLKSKRILEKIIQQEHIDVHLLGD